MKSYLLWCFGLLPAILCAQTPDRVMYYTQPANYFEEALVLGNGRIGATIHGGIQSDKIFLNEASLWAGGPTDPNLNPEAYTHLPAIREALRQENYRLADSLNQRYLQGKFSESYAPLGTLFIEMGQGTETSNYRRQLDLSTAISTTTYQQAGVTFTREYFISYPDQVMVIKLNASQAGKLNFKLRFNSQLPNQVQTQGNILRASGMAPSHAEPNYRRAPNPIQYDPQKSMRFLSLGKIIKADGKIIRTDSTIGIQGGREAILIFSIATSFNGFDKNPATQGKDESGLATAQLKKAELTTYANLRARHIKDYQQLFSRVALQLAGRSSNASLPTDERLKQYAQGAKDPDLEILYFNFGRYLLISSSRTPEIPANLQGIWNYQMRPPWSSNYTININTEMNYWPAESSNLSELHQPLLGFLGNLAKTGAVTAKTFYNAGGWCAAHNTDIWAMSNPVGHFGEGSPSWANWNMGGAWLATHLWEHFDYTRDTLWLKNYGYGLLKGAAQFCLDILVDDGKGHLVTSPSTSPENIYISDTGYKGATLYGGTADLAMIRELFIQTIAASKTLQTDAEFQQKLKSALDKLYPYQISKMGGHLQEWYHDWKDQDPKHRHQSHLFGLYPGNHINMDQTPELAAACKQTLEVKGDETTGWSKGWRTNLWARLRDGNRTYKMYRELLRYVNPDPNVHYSGGGAYPNLMDAHPPFQIDGNFGGSAAVLEMLVQSRSDEIFLLPALPDAWATGSVKGVCARGGFVIDLSWENGKLSKSTIRSPRGGKTKVHYGEKSQNLVLKKGEQKNLLW